MRLHFRKQACASNTEPWHRDEGLLVCTITGQASRRAGSLVTINNHGLNSKRWSSSKAELSLSTVVIGESHSLLICQRMQAKMAVQLNRYARVTLNHDPFVAKIQYAYIIHLQTAHRGRTATRPQHIMSLVHSFYTLKVTPPPTVRKHSLVKTLSN